MYAALAPLTDKMDTKYIIPSEAYESHDDEHPKKKHVGHLGFWRKQLFNASYGCQDYLISTDLHPQHSIWSPCIMSSLLTVRLCTAL